LPLEYRSGLMDPFLPAPEHPPVSELLARLVAVAEANFRAARKASTYTHDWRQFRVWCEQNGFIPFKALGRKARL
jgi:hypothetical protein